jgi:hypothetical protein
MFLDLVHTKKNAAQHCMSISETPMLHIPIMNYASPLLHIWLGIAGDLLLLFERILLQLDARIATNASICGLSFHSRY